ncbi:MAG: hypothetical protein UH080_03720 [Ruminococcus sp.]|nr:hypothetical protein [Ruminococcus sp.]
MKKILSVILTAVMLLSISPITAFAGGDEIELSLDTPYEVWVDKNAEVYRFTPSDDGWYRFYTSGDFDTYATLYNSNWDQITFADDWLADTDFDFSCKLYAGYTYYLEVGAYVEELELAKFNLYVCETVGVEEAVITKEPDDKTCIIGLENETVDLTGMEVTFTLSNGEEVLWSYDNSSYVAGNMVYVYTDYDGMGHYYVDVMCGDVFERLYLDMIENPVESISVYSMSAIELYENSCGYLYDGEYIYDYRIPDDAKMQINYKDGSSAVVDYQGITSDGFYFRSDDIQYYAPWSVGDNEFTITIWVV